jgi:hypothetical protein
MDNYGVSREIINDAARIQKATATIRAFGIYL